MTSETLKKSREVGDKADPYPLHLAEGALRAAGLSPVEGEEPKPEPARETEPAPPQEPRTRLGGDDRSLGLVMAAERGFAPRPR